MSNIDKQQIRDDIARRKLMPYFGIGPDHSLARLKTIQETQRSFGLEVVEALLDELESVNRLNIQLQQKCEIDPRTHQILDLEERIAELERKEQHSERQSVIDALAGSGEEWSDIEEYMQKWDAERAAAAGKGEAS
ncbi:Uncharacterised protein [Enterobacter cloacae]|nr:Uncharacterised protein [Enterobacter cloacae]